MRQIFVILTASVILLVSCEKPVDKGEYGNPLIKFYGDAFADIGNSIIASDNGFVICGSMTIMERELNESGDRQIVLGSEHLDMGVIFTDRNGIQTHKLNIGTAAGDDVGRKIIYYNGYYYCVGTASIERGGSIDKDVIVAIISPGGELIDKWYYGGELNQEGYDIILNNDNSGFVICGSSDVRLPGTEKIELAMKIWEISFTGELIRQKARTYDFDGDDVITRIISNHGNGYITIGTTYELPSQVVSEIRNMFIIKTNDEFIGIDYVVYDNNSNINPKDLAFLNDGGLLVAGTGESGGEHRGFLLKLIAPLGELNTNAFNIDFSTAFGSYNAILPLADNQTYVVGGSIDMAQGNLSSAENLFLFLDSDLNTVLEPSVTGGIGRQVINDIYEGSDGKLIATGSNGDDIRSLMTLLKFDPWE